MCVEIKDFRLNEVIGSGTYSTVYKAFYKDNPNPFAIKTVAKKELSPGSTDNLIREIGLLKSLKHQYIVEMTNFCWDDKNIYIIMEYCNAGNLSAYIKKHRTLPEPTCKFFLKQLASALKYMRSHNVSHFDLKPHNLLLTRIPSICLKVADFGFAQHLNIDQEDTVLKGSPLYMAPEIILDHCYDPSADLWSIGVILYECLFGRAPYSSESMIELLQKIKSKQKIVLPKMVKISVECKDMLTRLLVHDRRHRMTFNDFFAHEFLDLKYELNEKSLSKATDLFTKAVEADSKKSFEQAYHLYCEGLQYFLPIVTSEQNNDIKQQLKIKALSYMKRAEEIKLLTKNPVNEVVSTESSRITAALTPSPAYTQLLSLSASSPSIQNALQIGRDGELYAYENNLPMALDSLRSALGILVSSYRDEPKGQRKDLLHQHMMKWMQEAESIKSLLYAHSLENEHPSNQSTSGSSTTNNTHSTANSTHCTIQ